MAIHTQADGRGLCERASEDDRKFFENNPTRKYRLRPAFDLEAEDAARASRMLGEEDKIWSYNEEFPFTYVIVTQVAPGVRMRMPISSKAEFVAETDDVIEELLEMFNASR